MWPNPGKTEILLFSRNKNILTKPLVSEKKLFTRQDNRPCMFYLCNRHMISSKTFPNRITFACVMWKKAISAFIQGHPVCITTRLYRAVQWCSLCCCYSQFCIKRGYWSTFVQKDSRCVRMLETHPLLHRTYPIITPPWPGMWQVHTYYGISHINASLLPISR